MRLADKIATMARRGAPLPYDAEVEWIEFTGSQYIKTGLVYETQVTMIARAAMTAAVTQFSGMGGLGGERFNFGVSSTIITINVGFLNNVFIPYDSEIHEFVVSNSRSSIDGNTGSGGSLLSVNNMILVGARNQMKDGGKTADNLCYMRLYSMRIDASKIMDFKIVRFTNENGISEGAMYDRVSGQLFRNAGTGAFVICPDKVSTEGGGTKCLTPRRSYRRLARPSVRFCAHSQEWEVAA